MNRPPFVGANPTRGFSFVKNHRRLSEAIRCVQEQNHWAYGSKRMARWLVSEGFADRLNHKRVERVMGKFDLHAKIRRDVTTDTTS